MSPPDATAATPPPTEPAESAPPRTTPAARWDRDCRRVPSGTAAHRTPPSPTRRWSDVDRGLTLLLAALAAGIVAQGGFYPAGRILLAVLALAATLASRAWSWGADRLVLWAGVVLAGWAVVRAAMNGSVSAGVPAVMTSAGLLAAFVVVRRADAARRQWCAEVLVGIGVLVGISAWVGVAWRWPVLAPATGGVWRATSTLTYANAAAAVLACLSLLAVALLVRRPPSVLWSLAVSMSLVGLGATLSRGGMLAFLVGLVALAALAGVRLVVWRTAPAFLGAAFTLGALVPSMPSATSARPVVALAGMAVGAVTTMTLTRLHGRLRANALLVGVAAGAAAATRLPATIVRPLLDRRATLDSFGRVGAARSALDQVAARPFTGVGPGHALFPWTTVDGRLVVQRYAHNEYLQILVELGAVGLLLLLVLLVAMANTIRRGREGAEVPQVWIGAVAALIALATHSGFDFLWQLPVIPLCAGLLAGLAAPGPLPPARRPPPTSSTTRELATPDEDARPKGVFTVTEAQLRH